MGNGLISRVFSLSPNGATVGFENLMAGESLLRSVRTEAEINIEGIALRVGGLTGQPVHNDLLKECVSQLKRDLRIFVLKNF